MAPSDASHRAELIAHRAGNRRGLVEAVAATADTIELDLRLERGRMVVRHPRRVWGTDRLFERTANRWHLLPAGATGLDYDEAIGPVIDRSDPGPAGGLGLWIDCKGVTPRLPPRAVERARARGHRGPVTVSSKAWWMLGSVDDHPEVRVVRSVSNRLEVALLTGLPSRVRIDGVVAHARLLSSERVAHWSRRFGPVFSWAIPDEATGRRLIDWGVAGLIVDDHEVLRTLRDG